jgi:hypothetical protein
MVDKGSTEEESVEYIEYNIIRVLPYYGDRRPIILFREDTYDENAGESDSGVPGPVPEP